MATLKTMNRRRWRKLNPVEPDTIMGTMDLNAMGRLRAYIEGIRGGRWVRYTPRTNMDVRSEFDEVHGVEEGQTCERNGCQGVLTLEPNSGYDGCSCHINPPCNYCMSKVPECPVCGWRDEEPC